MKKRILLNVGTAVGIVMMAIHTAHADAIGSALDAIQGWLTTVLGTGLILIGGAIVGIRMAMGDEDAWNKGKGVLIGGLIIFLTKAILTLIRGWAGQ